MNFDLINFFIERAPECYRDIARIHETFPFELLLADSAFTASPLVKARLHVPVVAIGVIPLAETSADLAPYGSALPPALDEAQRTQYAQMRAHAIEAGLKPAVEAFSNVLTAHGLSPTQDLYLDVLIRQADLYLQIGAPGFEYERPDLWANVRFVGALLPYAVQQQEQRPWHDERLTQYRRVVLVTQGTAERNPQKLLEPALTAFQGDPDTLVIATTGGHGTAELRAKFSEPNFMIEDYLPFQGVMAHADVYVSNGGYGGVLLALQHRLPLVVAGLYELKNEICARVGYFHLGQDLKTETPTPEAVREAVAQVLADPTYAQNVARLADEFATIDSLRLSAGCVAEVLTAVPA